MFLLLRPLLPPGEEAPATPPERRRRKQTCANIRFFRYYPRSSIRYFPVRAAETNGQTLCHTPPGTLLAVRVPAPDDRKRTPAHAPKGRVRPPKSRRTDNRTWLSVLFCTFRENASKQVFVLGLFELWLAPKILRLGNAQINLALRSTYSYLCPLFISIAS